MKPIPECDEAALEPEDAGGQRCITCSDLAERRRIVELLQGDLARVDNGEIVSVALVEARVGDTILIHAGEALSRLAS